ncbi:hypothetical protein MMSR116_05905 [Methylobacterium mesophilicum SR1.6/6]|uniref:Uncharacterized protein n=1 Tax=Methylobacterium mesophilicum SR1.6/6 TaxID=908290 RepID=A0A6B9FFX1_9HYPH|nr:hypothetical protein [Methylobacterium mesophilicum]QGY01487.1 hypothetical protein MMSR116_05905 [Methylobacterium mesophilicum SR1.6/6]
MRAAVIALAFLIPTGASAEPNCRMTLDQFEAIRLDWAISRVSNLLGCVGDVTAESKFGDLETKVLIYPGDRGNFQLMFQNRRLVRKLKLS